MMQTVRAMLYPIAPINPELDKVAFRIAETGESVSFDQYWPAKQ